MFPYDQNLFLIVTVDARLDSMAPQWLGLHSALLQMTQVNGDQLAVTNVY